MKITISKKQIKKCVELLPNEYYKSAKLIKFYNTWRKHILGMIFSVAPRYKKDNTTLGCFTHPTESISVLSYKLNSDLDINGNTAQVIHTMFHEIRHWYQYNFQYANYCDEFEEYIEFVDDGIANQAQQIELDADDFASDVLRKNKEALCEILNIEDNWHI